MPLNVSIAVNDRQIHALKIGRLEKFDGPDKVYKYLVIRDDKFSTAVEFDHLYSDGALVCIERALQALRGT